MTYTLPIAAVDLMSSFFAFLPYSTLIHEFLFIHSNKGEFRFYIIIVLYNQKLQPTFFGNIYYFFFVFYVIELSYIGFLKLKLNLIKKKKRFRGF